MRFSEDILLHAPLTARGAVKGDVLEGFVGDGPLPVELPPTELSPSALRCS